MLNIANIKIVPKMSHLYIYKKYIISHGKESNNFTFATQSSRN